MLLQTAVLNPVLKKKKKKGQHQRLELELDEQTSSNDFFATSVLINHSSVLPLHGPFLCHCNSSDKQFINA